jgi:hypothetical protein
MKKLLFCFWLFLYTISIQAQTPVAYYPFSGNANDAIGTNHGTVNGATLTTDRFGNANSAYSFNGTNNTITTSNLASTQSDNFTMSAWIKPSNINQLGFIMQNGDITGNVGHGYGLVMSGNNASNAGFGNSLTAFYAGVAYVNSGGTFPTANIWYHVVLVRSNGITIFYINGTQTANTSTTTVNTPIGSLIIGGLSGSNFFNGAIDEVKIYNTALSGAQVLAEYNASSNNGLIAYYPFTNNANDAVGSNNGTVNGATLTTDRFGNANSAYAFDGINDVVELNHAFNGFTEFTISAWVKLNGANQANDLQAIVSSDASGKFAHLQTIPGTANNCAVYINGNSNVLIDHPAPILNNWYQVTMVAKSGANKMYINGAEVFSDATTFSNISNTNLLRIGSGYLNGRFFKGAIDEVKIYNSALTAAQVQAELGSSLPKPLAFFSGGTGAGCNNIGIGQNNGSAATGIGCGGGGAGYWGGHGGAGYFGGGGGGANGWDSPNRIGGAGGQGMVIFAGYNVAGAKTLDTNFISGSSFTVPAGIDSLYIWAIGAGGGGAGANHGASGGGGGAGAICFKRIKITNPGTVITFNLGTSGPGGIDANNGQSGGTTTVTLPTATLIAQGGVGGFYNNGATATGGTFSGGDLGANGGAGSGAGGSNVGGGGGGALGTVNGLSNGCAGGTGGNTNASLFAISNSVPTLIASYSFSNNVNDSSGNNLHGTIIGAPTFTTDRNGNANSAMAFNGNVANRIEVDDNILLHTPSITIGAWVKFNSLGSIKTIVDKPLGGYVSDSWHFGTENSNFSCWHFNSTNTFPYSQVTNPVSTNQWYYVVNTFDDVSKQHKLYIDGVLKTTVTFNSTIGYDNSKMYIGAAIENGSLNFPMDGAIDDIKIYGSALTASQILDDYKSEVVASKPGSGDGVSLDGSDDYVQLPSVLDGATQFTVDFWIKTTENRNSGTFWQKPSILGNGNPGLSDGDFGITTSNGLIGLWHGFCCGDQSFQTTTAINDNKWHHVAAVNDGSNVVLFVDGIQLAGSIPTGGGALQNAARPWRLGMINNCCGGDTPHQGTMDEFRIWNIALTQAQIRDRMCKKIVSTDALYSNLSAYYNFDEKSGATVFDGSANSHTATLNNGASRIISGAPIGNSSSHDYSGASSSTNLANPNLGDDVTATLTAGGSSGIQVYHVNEAPNSVAGVEGLETIGTYFGTFVAGGSSPQYNLVYNYDGISSISNESNLVLGTRANNSVVTWAGITAALNTTANTLSVNAISNSQAEFRVAAQDAGLVSSSQANCFSYTPNPLTATPAFNNNLSATYQWQDSSVNGTWQNISGATNLAELTLPVATSTKYYRRLATLNGSTIFSNVVTIEAYTGPNPATFPSNAWNLYAYDGSSVDSVGINYKGYYSRSTIGFNTVADFTTNGNPSMATGYNGCSLSAPGNQWTMHMKRQGFPTGFYVLQIPQHDDNIRIIKDGVTIVNGGCCNNLGSEFYTLGILDANTKIECRVQNVGSTGHLQIALTQQALVGGTISGNQTNCGSFIPSILNSTLYAYGGSTTNITYQWQDSISGGVWTNISGATSLQYQPTTISQTRWYRRLANNGSEIASSNQIQVVINYVAGNPAVFGNNQWNVYAYNGTNLNLVGGNTYRGFYTNTNLNINTNNDWNSGLSPSAAANYQGCSVNVDHFTWIMKRQGFPTGNYYIDMPVMDNDFIILVNGSQVYQHTGGCCGPYNGVVIGVLNASSTVEIRVNDLGSSGEARVNFISDLQAGTIGSSQVFCNTGTIPDVFTSVLDAYGGLTPFTYQWQDSTAGGSWQDISGATNNIFQAPAVTQDIYYRRKAFNTTETVFSNQLFMDFQGVLFYQDTDGDGFGNPLVSQLACTVPSGFVANNTDCNDSDNKEFPGQVWYLDADGDGYAIGGTLTQCTRPSNRFIASELTATSGDCNDNNNHVHPGAQYMSYSGTPNFVTNICYPLVGDAYTTFQFQVGYFNIYNELPESGAPKLWLDLNQDGAAGPTDKFVTMVPDNVNDLTTSNGKRYLATISGIQPGIPITTIISPYPNMCLVYMQPNEPQVVSFPNLTILAKDISFSNFNPGLSAPLTVSATVTNESDFGATNFVVRLVNQFDTNMVIPNITVPYLAPYSSTTVSWNITTPPVAGLSPMKVFVDYTNVIGETNELDNTAIRGFITGSGSVQGGITVTSSVSPYSNYSSANFPPDIYLTGKAQYTGLAAGLSNLTVAGAEVVCTIVETGQQFSGNTDADGNFSVHLTGPVGLGIYHVSGVVYDFTFSGFMDTSTNKFEIIPSTSTIANPKPDLVGRANQVVESILTGQAISFNYTTQNKGTLAISTPFKTKVLITGPNGFYQEDSTIISSLGININTDANSTPITMTTPVLTDPGDYIITVTADTDNEIDEEFETNNYFTVIVNVKPPTIDLTSASSSSPYHLCNGISTVEINTRVKNLGTLPCGASQVNVNIKKGNMLIDSYSQVIASIPAGQEAGFMHTYTLPYTKDNYQYEVSVDALGQINETNELNNTDLLVLTVDTCQPDLISPYNMFCDVVDIISANNSYTGIVTLKGVIQNKGTKMALAPIPVRFLLSNNTFYDTVYTSNLAVGDFGAVFLDIPTLNVPASTTIKVVIDPLNIISEIREDNNESDSRIVGWDFYPSANSCIADIDEISYHTNSLMPVRAAVISDGLFDLDSLLVNFKIAGPGITGTLNLGETYIFNVTGTCACPQVANLPTFFNIQQQGTYTVTVTVDPNNDVVESNETNNILVITFVVEDKPDMRILPAYINPSQLNPIAGQSITTQVSYDNLAAPNLSDQMKLKLIIDNTVVDSITNAPGLVQFGKTTYTFNTPWSSTVPGVHIIRAVIDADNVINETDETNNMSVRPIIVGDAANMHFQSLTASHLYPSLLDSITILATIANNGALNCTSNVNFYFTNNLNDTIAFKSIPVTVPGNSNTPISFKWKVLDEQTTIVADIRNSTAQEFDYSDNDSSFQLGKMKLIFESEPACFAGNTGKLFAGILGGNAPYSYQWSTGASGSTLQDTVGSYSVIVTDATGQTTSDASSIIACLANLELKCFLQGYYVGSSSMSEALFNQGRINLHTHTDTLTVELRNPSTFTIEHSFDGILKTNGTMKAYFPLASIGSSYYLVLKHRNSIETWSAMPVLISQNMLYDFSTSAAMSFGNNHLQMEPSVFAIYTGDINQDGVVDGLDYNDWENDNNNFAGGYFSTDLNGDGIVDGLDFILWETNSNNFVGAVVP